MPQHHQIRRLLGGRRFRGSDRPAEPAAVDRGPPLPPAGPDGLDLLERRDRLVFRDLARTLGPIYRGTAWNEPYVCIVGLARARRFLQEHAPHILTVSQDLSSIFPKGCLRTMSDEDHRDYRRALLRATRGSDADAGIELLGSLIVRELTDQAAVPASAPNQADSYADRMNAIATGLLVRAFFGAEPGSDAFARLCSGFCELGPYGLVWNPKERQAIAYQRIASDIHDELERVQAGSGRVTPTCILSIVSNDGGLDEAMLGNLVFMVEMGRSDLTNLFRWLTYYSAHHPELLAQIAQDDNPEGAVRSRAEAFVSEVLRTDQSERLERRTTADVVFDGFLIPRDTPVRLCLWESHHDDDSYPDPFEFNPDRFLFTSPPIDRFSPFGIDHHQCPFGEFSIRIGTAFVRALATSFVVELIEDGPPVRGAYHWEPSRRMTVRLQHR